MITDLKFPHRSIPTLKLNERRITFNKAAIELLNLSEDSRVRVSEDKYQEDRSRILIGKSSKPTAYSVIFRDGRAEINSTPLCSVLKTKLSGTGRYRICEECSLNCTDGSIMYEVFFRQI